MNIYFKENNHTVLILPIERIYHLWVFIQLIINTKFNKIWPFQMELDSKILRIYVYLGIVNLLEKIKPLIILLRDSNRKLRRNRMHQFCKNRLKGRMNYLLKNLVSLQSETIRIIQEWILKTKTMQQWKIREIELLIIGKTMLFKIICLLSISKKSRKCKSWKSMQHHQLARKRIIICHKCKSH